jgi:hypothetical protein
MLLVIGLVGSLFTGGSLISAQETETIELQEDYEEMTIQSRNAQIEVFPSTNDVTTIEFTGNKENNQRYDVTANVEGDLLSVAVKKKGFKLFSFDFTFTAPALTVYVPEKTYDTIQIETNNGRAEARGLEAVNMQMEADNGHIVASESEVNELQVKADNGRIDLKNIRSQAVTSEADNGEIRLENVKGQLSGKTNNGKITMKTENLDHPIDLHTNNGKIHIQTENKPENAIFDVKTDNGKTTIFGESNWDTVVGDGENLIKLTTNNGSITVE